MSREQFAQKHRREEPDHTSLLDKPNIRIRQLDSSEGVTGGEHGVVERVGSVGRGFIEESREV
jgi:hypothetical protein